MLHSIKLQWLIPIVLLQNICAAEEFKLPISASIIFDTSGSMAGNKIEAAKNAFSHWIKTENTPVELWSLYIFSNGSPQKMIERSQNKDEVTKIINELKAGGGTPLYQTVRLVTNDIDKIITESYEGRDKIYRQIILIFTDGHDDKYSTEKVGRSIIALRNLGAEVISIGYDGEGQYLKQVSDGFILANNPDELSGTLQQISVLLEK